MGGYYLFRLIVRVLPRRRPFFLGAVAVTAWSTIVAAALLASVFIATGGPLPDETYALMVGIHMLIGIGEAVISVAVVAAVLRTRPDLLATQDLLPPRVPVGASA